MRPVRKKDIQMCKEGDEESFTRIYEAYKNIVFHECLLKLRCKEDAEDCFQEIFIKLINVINTFDECKSSFDTWFSTLYRNHIINYVRNKSTLNRNRKLVDSEEINQYGDTTRSNIDRLLDIADLVGDKAYMVLVYHIKYNYTYDAIAKMLGISRDKARRIYEEAMLLIEKKYK